jgi:hypothetical protein
MGAGVYAKAVVGSSPAPNTSGPQITFCQLSSCNTASSKTIAGGQGQCTNFDPLSWTSSKASYFGACYNNNYIGAVFANTGCMASSTADVVVGASNTIDAVPTVPGVNYMKVDCSTAGPLNANTAGYVTVYTDANCQNVVGPAATSLDTGCKAVAGLSGTNSIVGGIWSSNGQVGAIVGSFADSSCSGISTYQLVAQPDVCYPMDTSGTVFAKVRLGSAPNGNGAGTAGLAVVAAVAAAAGAAFLA